MRPSIAAQIAVSVAVPIATSVCLGCLLTACSFGSQPAEPGPGSGSGSGMTSTIDAYIASLPYLAVDEPSVDMGDPSAPQPDGEYSCSTQNFKETRQFDRIVAYAANSDSMYPGALIGADSVLTGLFTQIVLPRAPSTISVSLENIDGTKQATIAAPSLSAYRDALSSILDADITGSTPANIYSEIEEVHSEKQLNMALGIQASWGLGIASLKSSFDFSNKQTRSRYVVRYTQAYYTVDLDAPASPSALLAPDIALDDVQGKIDARHPPVYVSSVTYGRMVLFTFESAYSAQEMSAALDFAYSGGVDVKGDVSVSYKDIISQSKITAYLLGGDGGAAAETIDSYDALITFIKNGGNYTRQSPGAPIAYKLSYLKDNSPARMSFTTDYQVRDCVRVSQKIQVTLQSIAVDTASDGINDSTLELYGQITAQGSGAAQTLFNKDGAHHVSIGQGGTFGGTQPIAQAVIDVKPAAGQSIKLGAHLFDQDTFSDDDLGNEAALNPYETGWRKDVTLTLTSGSGKIRVNLSLSPI
jgi:thiol-activated cytolysin